MATINDEQQDEERPRDPSQEGVGDDDDHDHDGNTGGDDKNAANADHDDDEEDEKLLYVSDSRTFDAQGSPGVYTGTILPTAGGLPHGGNGAFCYIGAVTQTPIDKYVGGWDHGRWHGHGRCVMRNGDVYEGLHEYGQRHGTGVYTWKATKSTNPKAAAAASAAEAGGFSSEPRVYEGEFVQNQRHGQGTYSWGNLSYYKGTFVNGQRDGHGVYVHHLQKLEYVGEWTKGKYNGQGVLTYPCRHSVGTDVMTSAKQTLLATYKGNWRMGQRHGYGIETHGSGAIRHDGMWNHDTPMIVGSSNSTHRRTIDLQDQDQTAQNSATNLAKRASSASSNDKDQTKQQQQQQKQSSSSPSPSSVNTSKSDAQGRASLSQPAESAANTVVVNQERCKDARGFFGIYKGILFNELPQGVGTMNYGGTDPDGLIGSSSANENPQYNDANNPVSEYEGFWEGGKFCGFGRMLMKNGDKYVGNFENNQRHGSDGEYWYADGRHYKGDWSNGMRHGTGRFLYPDTGDLYQGEFVNGQRQGKGKFTFGKDGTSYDGEWFKGQYHGFGTLISETGAVYTGEFEYSLFQGQGKHVDPNGKVTFEGEFVDGLTLPEYEKQEEMEQKKGIFSKMADAVLSPGTMAARNTINLSDSFGNGNSAAASAPSPSRRQQPRLSKEASLGQSATSLLSNLMVPNIFSSSTRNLNTADSDEDAGDRKPNNAKDDSAHSDDANCKAVVDQLVWDGQNNAGRYTGILHVPTQRPHGVGRMVYKDGNRIYEGFWVKGHRQGHGRCMFVQMGDFHEGQYLQNLRHGPGKYIWKDGRRFVGEYCNDERHGNGKFWYPNGDVYEGMFEHGQRSGQGVFIFGPGCSYRGSWANGSYNGSGILQWTQTVKTSVSASMTRMKQADRTTVRTTKHKYVGEFRNGIFHGNGAEYEIVVDKKSGSGSGGSNKKPIEVEKVVRKGRWEDGEYAEEERDLITLSSSKDEENDTHHPGIQTVNANSIAASSNDNINNSSRVIVDEPKSPNSADGEWEKVAASGGKTMSSSAMTTDQIREISVSAESLSISKDDSFLPPAQDVVVRGANSNSDANVAIETDKTGSTVDTATGDLPAVRMLSKRSMSAPPPQSDANTLAREASSGEEQNDRDAWRSSLDMDV
mmetsp:Transcript_6226/g.18404  ORF Transcript_6226/g.18404 Transcript_6226/m.18404 type:complete len:1142 (+) Transcript_6226:157-3582(+)|eukprot:CAMPEP_0119566632 /NCGR_PEP_ID=MMETSP1352-20130426/33628_1 /TAXON_ID=265584 /ORGANISM="Stauroneis constricta, Strain CCMP1120" /LENGTH=1141 /DNA_ID=CAMNT_0007615775 /DNA_START=134 /DNA_END=3559 /DNA_ORIENTATION=-